MEHNFKKQFGQNFLQHVIWVERLVEAADITKEDLIIEIGPGAGVVTERLSQLAKQVISLEIDEELIPLLQEQFSTTKNVTILPVDVLQWDMAEIKGKKYKVVASLPYNISKKIINLFITGENKPEQMALLIQKEVAYDYVAQKPDAKFLGTVAQIYANIALTTTVPRNAFFPVPKVDGGILKFTNITPKVEEPQVLIKFIKLGYVSPRKKLSGNLANLGYDKAALEKTLQELKLSPTARAQELNLSDWQQLFSKVKAIKKKP